MSVEEKRAQAVGNASDVEDDEDFDQEWRQEPDIRRVYVTEYPSSAHYLKHLNNPSRHASLVSDLQRHHWNLKKLLEKEQVANYFFKS
jgi:hypothetical protein